MANINYHGWTPYVYEGKTTPLLTPEVVNRIRPNQRELFNTANYMIIYLPVEGGGAFSSSTANSNQVAGMMYINSFDSEEAFIVAINDTCANVHGIYKRV